MENKNDERFKQKLDERYNKLSEEEKNNIYNKQRKGLIAVSIVIPILLIIFAVIMVLVMLQENNKELLGIAIFGAAFLFIVAVVIPIILYKLLKDKEKTIKLTFKYDVKQELKQELEKEAFKKEFGDFEIDKDIFVYSVAQLANIRLLIDMIHKNFVFTIGKRNSKVYGFDKILSYEIYENGDSVVKGGAGKALIGGVFFGLTGAVIGSSMKRNIVNYCSSLSLFIKMNDIDNPVLEIPFINSQVSKNSSTYKNCLNSAKKVCGYLEYMMNNKIDLIKEDMSKETTTRTKRLTQYKCGNCGAVLSSEDRKNFLCPYCGSKFDNE